MGKVSVSLHRIDKIVCVNLAEDILSVMLSPPHNSKEELKNSSNINCALVKLFADYRSQREGI